MKSYEGKVFEIFSKVNKRQGMEVNKDTVINEMAVSSIKFIEALVQLEEELEIEFDDKELNIGRYKFMGDILEVIDKKI